MDETSDADARGKSGVGVGLGAAERNASFYMTLAASSHWMDKLTE